MRGFFTPATWDLPVAGNHHTSRISSLYSIFYHLLSLQLTYLAALVQKSFDRETASVIPMFWMLWPLMIATPLRCPISLYLSFLHYAYHAVFFC